MSSATLNKIAQVFPKALPNKELVARVAESLSKYGYGKTTLLGTSLCCDELSRPLEKEFQTAYGDHFSMGGLAGFPFGGLTSFSAKAAHIPDGGSCILCYGPHVGVCSHGNVGTVERRGRAHGGPCCGSANAACAHVLGALKNGGAPTSVPDLTDAFDAQQGLVGNLLMPQAQALADAEDVQVQLPLSLFQEQQKLMTRIVEAGAPHVADGMIAVLGGIQINTPPEMSDYFEPRQFDLYNNKGEKVDDLLW